MTRSFFFRHDVVGPHVDKSVLLLDGFEVLLLLKSIISLEIFKCPMFRVSSSSLEVLDGGL